MLDIGCSNVKKFNEYSFHALNLKYSETGRLFFPIQLYFVSARNLNLKL
jgi:hypothetical protein